MSSKITEILNAKKSAGPDAYLWLHDSGDCILWPDEASSESDNGALAVGRWPLSKAEVDELIDSGECDDVA